MIRLCLCGQSFDNTGRSAKKWCDDCCKPAVKKKRDYEAHRDGMYGILSRRRAKYGGVSVEERMRTDELFARMKASVEKYNEE